MTITQRLTAAALLITLAPAPAFATELDPGEVVTGLSVATALIGHLVYGDRQSYRLINDKAPMRHPRLNLDRPASDGAYDRAQMINLGEQGRRFGRV